MTEIKQMLFIDYWSSVFYGHLLVTWNSVTVELLSSLNCWVPSCFLTLNPAGMHISSSSVMAQSVCVCVSIFAKWLNVYVLTAVKIPSFSQDTCLLSSQILSAAFLVFECIPYHMHHHQHSMSRCSSQLLKLAPLVFGHLKGRQDALFSKIHLLLCYSVTAALLPPRTICHPLYPAHQSKGSTICQILL